MLSRPIRYIETPWMRYHMLSRMESRPPEEGIGYLISIGQECYLVPQFLRQEQGSWKASVHVRYLNSIKEYAVVNEGSIGLSLLGHYSRVLSPLCCQPIQKAHRIEVAGNLRCETLAARRSGAGEWWSEQPSSSLGGAGSPPSSLPATFELVVVYCPSLPELLPPLRLS